jgi:hypothetical protein
MLHQPRTELETSSQNGHAQCWEQRRSPGYGTTIDSQRPDFPIPELAFLKSDLVR